MYIYWQFVLFIPIGNKIKEKNDVEGGLAKCDAVVPRLKKTLTTNALDSFQPSTSNFHCKMCKRKKNVLISFILNLNNELLFFLILGDKKQQFCFRF